MKVSFTKPSQTFLTEMNQTNIIKTKHNKISLPSYIFPYAPILPISLIHNAQKLSILIHWVFQ